MMDDLNILLEPVLEYVAYNSTLVSSMTIVVGLLALFLFRRRKYLIPYCLLLMLSGPGLSFYASKTLGNVDEKPLPREVIDALLYEARSDYNLFKANLNSAVLTGKIRRSAADVYLQQARIYYRAFFDKMEKVPQRQRIAFHEMRAEIREEIKRAEETLGDLDFN